MVGVERSGQLAHAPDEDSEPAAVVPAVAVRGLVNRFGPQIVHDHLNLDLRRGEVLGVVGGSGTGKSVLLRSIIGLRRPDGGRIAMLGQTVFDNGVICDRRTIHRRSGILFQDGALFSSLTVIENVVLPMAEHTNLRPTELRELARARMALVGLSDDAGGKYPSQLSGGMRKRAGLARSLALDPEILFLDEPTAGLDPLGAAAFDQLIRDLQSSLGLTVFMVTHDLDSLAGICDRIAVLVDGQIVIGDLEALLQHDHPWICAYFHGPRARAAGVNRAAGVKPS